MKLQYLKGIKIPGFFHGHSTEDRRGKYLSDMLIMSLIFWMNSCGVYQDISAIADETTDFSVYKTFAWLPDQADSGNMPFGNEIIRNNIRNYFGQSFAERGYQVNLDSPDILLGIVITTKKMEKIVVYPTYPWPYYYGRYYYGSIYYYPYPSDYYYRHHIRYPYPPGYNATTYTYLESSIVLNVIDRKQNKLVWSGMARGDIYDPLYIDKNIHPAVEAIMKKYPVPPINP